MAQSCRRQKTDPAWYYTGDVWRSEPNEQFEHFEHGEYDDDEYDDGDYHDDDNDHNEEDDDLFMQ